MTVLECFSISTFPGREKDRSPARGREVVGIAPQPLLTPLPAPRPLWRYLQMRNTNTAGGDCEREQTARLALSPQVLFPLLPPTPPTFLQLLLFPPTQQL